MKLYRCDFVAAVPKPNSTNTPIKVNVVINQPNYDLRAKDHDKTNKATSTSRSSQSISQNVSYINIFRDSSLEDTANEGLVQAVGPGKSDVCYCRFWIDISLVQS